MVFDNVLDAIGHTPMIRLSKLHEEGEAEIYAKFEGLNVGGSVKTRTALEMIEAAEREGLIGPDSVIVEPTSGNQGIGIALVCAAKGYKARIIMPDSVSEERRKIVRHYGADVVLVHDADNIGDCIEECIALAQKMAAEDPNVYVPQQFENKNNLLAHEKSTALEIIEDIDVPIDGFVSGIGTGGTITGVGGILRKQYPDIEIWAIEPENAAILSGGRIGTHIQMGVGDGLVPSILDTHVYDEICLVSDEEAIQAARELASIEGILCGISSGTNYAGAKKLARKLGEGKVVVTILPDTGERYFSTPLFSD